MKKNLIPHWRKATRAGLPMLVWLACLFSVEANPTGGSVVQGSAAITTVGSQVTISQSSANAFINWQSFNLVPGETTTFNQPSASSVTWNYISDTSASSINGNINANGYVVLQNPNGFTIGGQAAITTHGLIMTTASTPSFDLSGGGAWSFSAPPPTAKIVNYGQINMTGGGSAFLIASDIENNGTISAPGGKIGLYAGQKVLVSLSPDGRGLSAEVTVPEGSVNNQGSLIADGGSITAQAQFVNQAGLVQANTVQNVNGTIELVASDALNLGASSTISAQGDSTASGASQGGFVVLNAGQNTFSDQMGSSVSVDGANGGQGGIVEVFGSGIDAGSLQSGFGNPYALLVNPYDMTLSAGVTSAGANPTLNLDALAKYSQIDLQALNNIELDADWTLTATPNPAALNLTAGNNLVFTAGKNLIAGSGWNLDLTAGGVSLNNNSLQADNITIHSGAIHTTQGGDIKLLANHNLELDSSWTLADAGATAALNLTAGNNLSLEDGIAINAGQGWDLNLSPNRLFANHASFQADNLALAISVVQAASGANLDFQAANNINLSTAWTLADSADAAQLNLSAGNNINLSGSIAAGNNWSLDFNAGTAFSGATPNAGADGIYLLGSSYLQTKNGDITLNAANEVQVGWSGQSLGSGVVNHGAGGIRTIGGGSIAVTALYGDVNSGSSSSGFNYIKNTPYFTPFQVNQFLGTVGTSSSLGGISTAAGGNVKIAAGGNVISYLPTGTGAAATGDAGTGAFGSQPGNVNITAGGNVYGHYVVVNGSGNIAADGNIGNASKNVALSLVKGTWALNTSGGDIYLQEVRNPNGVFNTQGTSSTSQHFFNYDPLAAVSLNAADGVYLTGANLPRSSDALVAGINYLPIMLPPSLSITAGSGGVTLENNFTLFASADGNLDITTTAGGNFSSGGAVGGTYTLAMSDSVRTHWMNDGFTFGSTDHGTAPVELDNPDPVLINIDGSMNKVILTTTKQTRINVGGDMTDCGFYGQNLRADDITSITVAGKISNAGSFNYVTLNQGIQNVPLTDLPPNVINNWQTALTLALDPARVATLVIPAGTDPSQYASYVNGLLLFGNSLQSSLAYDVDSKRLTYIGPMTQTIKDALSQPLTVVRYGPDGNPLVDASGHLVTDTLNWAPAASIQDLYTASQGAPALGNASGGYVVGGTGHFNVAADSISLGNAYGILSLQNGQLLGKDYSYLTSSLQDLPGASIDATVNNNLEMPSSTIAALGSGDVKVTSLNGSMDLGSQYLVQFEAQIMNQNNLGLGIYTSGGGDATVTALGNINVDSSRIATFNGGDIFIESFAGDVNAGSGGNVSIPVNVFSPLAASLTQPFEYVYANGIVAQTLVNPSLVPGSAEVPGNITILTPQGSIYASQGGILQEALNGNISAGPTITLTAGSEGHVGNIDLGDSGVIGGTVNLTANGNITGLVISRQNSNVNAAQSFSGTVLSGGTANLSAGGSVSGTIIGAGGVNAAGAGGVTATLLGQNVSVNGGASQSTLGTSATATSTSQSAAGTSSAQAQQQVASDADNNDDLKKKKKPQIRKVSRVTVILSSAIPPQ